ncbi:MAG: AIR synthase family protein [Armatimonadota bacterium]|nr:AIR synthase family protein [Armatimonadota bacterium]
MKLRTGKLPPEILNRLLRQIPKTDGVLVGPAYGEDAAAVELGDTVLVVASDPVTFASDLVGHYAVVVNANDVAAHGARPLYFTAVIMLPEGVDESCVEHVFSQINESCCKLGVALVGGHTEVTPTVNRTVVCGCMIGTVPRDRLVMTRGAVPGNDLILVGGIAIEGTAILAKDAREDLMRRGVSLDVMMSASRFLDHPGICVVDYAMAAVDVGGVTSMHDPTEGGLAMALRELAAAADVGLAIRRDAVPILPESRIICNAVGIDPMGLISSGSLLVACKPEKTDEILRRVRELGVSAEVIGKVVDKGFGVKFDGGEELPYFERDEIARYFEGNV